MVDNKHTGCEIVSQADKLGDTLMADEQIILAELDEDIRQVCDALGSGRWSSHDMLTLQLIRELRSLRKNLNNNIRDNRH